MDACQTPLLPRIGCHLSLGSRPDKSIGAAHENGVRCLQIFASSPAAWKPPIAHPNRIADLRRARESYDVNPLFIHAIYLINLASEDPGLRQRSRESLTATLRAGEALGARGVVTHLGSHAGREFEAVVDVVAGELERILVEAPGSVQLILENSAGSGSLIGSRLAELGMLIKMAGGNPRLGIALDTSHLCGAGWDFQEPNTALRLVDDINTNLEVDRLALLHVNDSKVPVGSGRDRHATIGTGYIGLAGFRQLLRQEDLSRVPWILETPDLDASLPAGERFASVHTLYALCAEQSDANCERAV